MRDNSVYRQALNRPVYILKTIPVMAAKNMPNGLPITDKLIMSVPEALRDNLVLNNADLCWSVDSDATRYNCDQRSNIKYMAQCILRKKGCRRCRSTAYRPR